MKKEWDKWFLRKEGKEGRSYTVEQRKDHMPMELVDEEVNTKIIKFHEIPAAKITELLFPECFRKLFRIKGNIS